MDRYVLISLHDITPFHLKRLKQAESLFAELGLCNVTYLFIPDYHNLTATLPPEELAAYRSWIHQKRTIPIQWVLHGYSHLETSVTHVPRTAPVAKLKRRFLTAGEAEFLSLDRQSTCMRIQQGIAAFESHLDTPPTGFVAPAWLFKKNLITCLKELGFLFTEDHNRVYFLAHDQQLRAPVITWATRTSMRKYSSVALCPLLSRVWSNHNVIRIAIHPYDFDHPSTVNSIRRVIKTVTKGRRQVFYTHFLSNS